MPLLAMGKMIGAGLARVKSRQDSGSGPMRRWESGWNSRSVTTGSTLPVVANLFASGLAVSPEGP